MALVDVKIICCAAGRVPPCGIVKVSDVGETLTVAFVVTVNTTGIVSCPLGRFVAFTALIVIDPV